MLAVVKRIERIRLYPTTRQTAGLAFMLDVTRELYNALLQQRRDAYRLRKVTVTAKMQYAEITALRAEDRRLRAAYRECEDAVLHRLDLAMTAFFRRCKRGETPGYPRFRSRQRWQQIEFPHGDRALRFDQMQQRVTIPGVGVVKLRKGDRYQRPTGLNRRLLDSGFGLLRQMIVAKAEEAARTVVEVESRFSSQECSHCGHVASESRRRRRFCCVWCGYRSRADVNAALVIRGRAQLALKSEL
jgi:transposase